ncbi:MAG TPA: hypothetical protein VE693_00370 [Gaiellaceae bacterium]|jgi:hypothetical protein|nr:hypothetical protein [Gaiellaceae bacterium]
MDTFELPPARRLHDRQIARLEQELLSEFARSDARHAPVRRRRRLSRRRIVGIGIAACAATGSALALAGAFGNQPGTDIACLSDPSLSARVYDMVPNKQDPISACAREWQRGVLSDNRRPTEIPNLVSCLTSRNGHDQIVVFPTDDSDLCRRLGLEPYTTP